MEWLWDWHKWLLVAVADVYWGFTHGYENNINFVASTVGKDTAGVLGIHLWV